jgi:hypothetical protein
MGCNILNNLIPDDQVMPASGLLYLGESFAEIGVISATGLIQSRRWYVGRGPVTRGLSQFLTEHNQTPLSEMLIVNKSTLGVLRRRLGSSTAFLVTAGFENWLTMNRPIRQKHFTVHAERAASILDSSMIFGLSERMSPEGKPEKPVETADLEFLAAKLKLHSVEEVAVGLLHSGRNPLHEQHVGQFLRDQGFRVHLSSDLSRHDYEVDRWWAAITNAYLGHRHREILTEVKTAMQESGHLTADLKVVGGQGLIEPEANGAPLDTLFGSLFVLNKWRQRRNSQALLYLGVEDFFLFDGRWPERKSWRADYGPVGAIHPAYLRVDLQATQLVQKSFWGVASLSRHEGGFEPGPMCLGKGLVPQYLDILWLLGRIDNLPGLSDRWSEKSRARIEEALTALARETGQRQRSSPKELALALEAEGARRLAAQLPLGATEVTVCGPLSGALKPSLEPAFKDLGAKADWLTEPTIMLSALAEFSLSKTGAH